MSYKVYMIESYVLRYDRKSERPWIIFHYKVDGNWRNVNWFPPKENAVYIADLLRNEKPVYWVPEGNYLTSSFEVVGEEETQRLYYSNNIHSPFLNVVVISFPRVGLNFNLLL
jgi:hypothetical protein